VAGDRCQNELCRDGIPSEIKRVSQTSPDCDRINCDRINSDYTIFRDKLYASKLPDDV
jgi:hypothetical protein